MKRKHCQEIKSSPGGKCWGNVGEGIFGGSVLVKKECLLIAINFPAGESLIFI